MKFKVGEISFEEDQVVVNNVRLTFFKSAVLEAHTPTILFVHGVACHARTWDATLRRLNSKFPIVCVELRGHGRSDKHGPYGWGQFGSDLCAFIQVLELSSIIGVGHSMGGHLLLQAASVHLRKFRGLLLFDPVVFAPSAYALSQQTKLFDSPNDHPFARRRAIWDSPEVWYHTIRKKSPFNLWTDEALRDLCEHGLERNRHGKYQLRCPPIVEAEASLASADTNVHSLLPSIEIPVEIYRAKTARGFRHPMDNIHSVTWPQLAESLPKGRDTYLPDLSHFIPMQCPKLVARELSRWDR